jgi:hypothetical protein
MGRVGLYSSMTGVASPRRRGRQRRGKHGHRGFWGHRGGLEQVKRVWRTHWHTTGRKNGTGNGRTTKEGTSGGSGSSDEEFWLRRRGLGRAKAWANYGRVRGTLRTKAEAQDRAKSANHWVGAANRRGQT